MNNAPTILKGLWDRLARSSGKPRWYRKALIKVLTAHLSDDRNL